MILNMSDLIAMPRWEKGLEHLSVTLKLFEKSLNVKPALNVKLFLYPDFHRISFTLHARNNTWRVVVNMFYIYLSLSVTFSGLPTRLSWVDAGSLLCAPRTRSRESMKQQMPLYVFWLGRLREQPVPASSSQLRFGLLFVFRIIYLFFLHAPT